MGVALILGATRLASFGVDRSSCVLNRRVDAAAAAAASQCGSSWRMHEDQLLMRRRGARDLAEHPEGARHSVKLVTQCVTVLHIVYLILFTARLSAARAFRHPGSRDRHDPKVRPVHDRTSAIDPRPYAPMACESVKWKCEAAVFECTVTGAVGTAEGPK